MLPEEFSPEMITWTLTIPAAWNAASKTSMRNAALQAGIISSLDSDALVLLRDTDAAALYSMKKEQRGLVKGSSFLVIDVGGAITDITMHTVEDLDDVLALNETTHRAGMMIGGMLVDQVRFHDVLGVCISLSTPHIIRNLPASLCCSSGKIRMQYRCVGVV